eukprot:scaffold1638_cov258-Pinguiococcus_pyrenoidosus.AAC.46
MAMDCARAQAAQALTCRRRRTIAGPRSLAKLRRRASLPRSPQRPCLGRAPERIQRADVQGDRSSGSCIHPPVLGSRERSQPPAR